ncbi:DUF2577 domain-containing protein [Peptococcaceae bacterium 1198_IL3148]
MRDANTLVRLIKQTALDAVNASNPTMIRFGNVISTSPLKIQIDQKLILSEVHLVLTRNVTDFELQMTVDHTTEVESGPENHKHDYKGRKNFKVHNALKVGEKVILLRVQGGKQYVVVDRV